MNTMMIKRGRRAHPRLPDHYLYSLSRWIMVVGVCAFSSSFRGSSSQFRQNGLISSRLVVELCETHQQGTHTGSGVAVVQILSNNPI